VKGCYALLFYFFSYIAKNILKNFTKLIKKSYNVVDDVRGVLMMNAQYQQFAEFLNEKVATTKSDFIKAMHQRLAEGKELTPNMVSSLQNAILRDQQYKKDRAERENAPKPTKTFKMRKWWVNEIGLHSRVVTVEIHAETERAYKVTGHADIVNGSWCMRCGRKLTQPASFTIGFGAECADKVGIPYPKELNTMSEKELKEYREKLLGILQEQTIDMWLPKSQIDRVIR
jgi:hypothetical protein